MYMPDFDAADEPYEKAPLVERLEEKLRSIWIEEVNHFQRRATGRVCTYRPGPRLDGGIDQHGTKFKPVWPKLAAFVRQYNLNPVKFIKAQFHNCRGKPPLSPNMLTNQAAINRYRAYMDSEEEIEKELTISKNAQTRHAQDALEYALQLYPNRSDAYKSLLLDDNVPISALFRYCFAVSCKENELARTYFNLALDQVLTDPEVYIRVWNTLLPDDLVAVVKGMLGGPRG